MRLRTRSGDERTNARLRDEFGGRHVRVGGHSKGACHLMFGILALTVDHAAPLSTEKAMVRGDDAFRVVEGNVAGVFTERCRRTPRCQRPHAISHALKEVVTQQLRSIEFLYRKKYFFRIEWFVFKRSWKRVVQFPSGTPN